MAEHVRIYEEKKSTSIWLWLLPLLLLLALLAFFLLRHRAPAATAIAAPVATTPILANPNPALPEIGTIHFATGTAAITPEGKATLDRAAAAMKTHPEARLRIEGFTDSTGPAALNDVLSQQRALAAANYLKAEGIEGSRLTGEGFGPDDPAGDNAGSSGRADNRRAELFVSH
jgi:outer membrane protein OmpA-like peptidoglycan-associated protein